MILSFSDFVTLSGELVRRSDDGRLWRSIGGGALGGMWRKIGFAPNAMHDLQQELHQLPAQTTAITVGIAAAVTLAGVGWIIHRRNLLAGTEDASSNLIRDLGEWMKTMFMALLRIKKLPEKWRGKKVLQEGQALHQLRSHAIGVDETEEAV